MNEETDELSRYHVRFYSGDLELLRAAYPVGQVNNKLRDIVHDYCEAHHAELCALASTQR